MARTFGKRSLDNLAGVHPLMVKVAYRALELSKSDFTVICGYRSEADQNAAFASKNTKVKFPNSAHNQRDTNGNPKSCAIDVIPFPFTNWDDPAMFRAWKQINDAMEAAAKEFGLLIRWGGDFRRDGDKTTTDAWDKPHFELHPWRNYAG